MTEKRILYPATTVETGVNGESRLPSSTVRSDPITETLSSTTKPVVIFDHNLSILANLFDELQRTGAWNEKLAEQVVDEL